MKKGRAETLSPPGEQPPLGDLLHLQNLISSESGYEWLNHWSPDTLRFKKELKQVAEGDLYFFAKLIMGMKDMTQSLHGRVASWLQDGSHGHAKLLIMAMGHLKTSLCTHSQTVHFIIQPPENNIYIPGLAGNEGRYLFASENEAKAKENLDFIKQHLMHNLILRWLWPHVCWGNVKDSPRWTETALSVPRSGIHAEPTLTAVGRGSGIYQRHYDGIWLDDILGMEDALSMIRNEEAKRWRKGIITRGHIPTLNWEFGIGTPWSTDDVYIEWREELPPENVLTIPAMEDGEPVWPERYSVARLNEIRKRLGDALFSLGYMVKAVNAGFTALDWECIRQFTLQQTERGLEVVFKEIGVDETLTSNLANRDRLHALRRGDPLRLAYPTRPRKEPLSEYSITQMRIMRQLYPDKAAAAGLPPLSEDKDEKWD